MGYIYKIYSDLNNKVYVGKTCLSVEKRFKQHLIDSEKRRNENRPLYSAIRRYGKDHFFISELEECSDDVLSEREKYWIEKLDSFRNGYNATTGGDGKIIFDHEVIFENLILCPYSSQVADKIGCSVDLVREIAYENGVVLKSESQEHMKQNKSKAVICESDDLLIVFDSIADAARWLHSNGIVRTLCSGVRSHISDCARGKRMSAYGFEWRFI